MPSNPNGANQHIPDPRQALFLAGYLDPKSQTFGNGLQSALAAGYDENYAKTLTAKMPTWLEEKVRDSYIVQKAEKNLQEFIEMETKNNQTTKDGSVFEYDDPQLKRIKADITKFALERLAKGKYAQRNENEIKVKELPKPLLSNLDVQSNNSTQEAENTQ